jgi:hypothetical protein
MKPLLWILHEKSPQWLGAFVFALVERSLNRQPPKSLYPARKDEYNNDDYNKGKVVDSFARQHDFDLELSYKLILYRVAGLPKAVKRLK